MLVATIDGWEVITAVYETGIREQTFDIEVENTHNFIGNNIVAHNTSIFGAGEGGTPTATTLRGAAASGTNIAGANFTFDASNGTGTGGSGALIFRTAPTGSTGTTANTLAEIMRITPGGNVGIGTTAPATKLQISGGDLYVSGSHDTISGSTSWSNIGTNKGVAISYDTTNNRGRIASVFEGTSYSPLHIQSSSLTFSLGSSVQRDFVTLSTSDTEATNKFTIGPSGSGKARLDVNYTTGGAEVDGAISRGISVSHSGAISDVTAYAGYFSKTGAGLSNVGLYATATGGTTNYAAIFEAGNVGIGTISPAALLQVGTNTDATTNTRMKVIGYSDTNPLIDLGDGTGAVYSRIQRTSGNTWNYTWKTVPIGETVNWSGLGLNITASNNLGGNVPTISTFGMLNSTVNGDAGTQANYYAARFMRPTLVGNSATMTVTTAATVYIENAPTASTNAAISNAYALYSAAGTNYFGGNVGIGTTAPTQKLHVEGGLRVTTSVAVTDDRTLCTVAASGEVEFVNGACGTSSIRYKENVRNLGYGLNDIMALRPVFFNYIKDGDAPSDLSIKDDRTKRRIGFIAEEMGQVIPEVTIWQNGQIESIDHSHITALLVKGIQEQQEQINQLKAMYKTDDEGYLVMPKIKADKIIVNDSLVIGDSQEGSSVIPSKEGIQSSGQFMDPRLPAGRHGLRGDDIVGSWDDGTNYIDVAAKLTSLQSSVHHLLDGTGLQTNQIATNSAQLAVLGENVASQSARIDELKRQLEALLGLNKESSPSSQPSPLKGEGDLASSIPSPLAGEGQGEGDVALLNLTPPDILLATGSATLAKIDITEKASILNLEALDATISATFKSLGETFLGRTTVAGDFSIDGTLSITGNSLNSIACHSGLNSVIPRNEESPADAGPDKLGDSSSSTQNDNGSGMTGCGVLYLQNSPFASLVDIFNGLVTIDNTGKLAVHKLAVSSDTLGTVTIKAGQRSVEVITTQLTRKSKVFTTSSKPAVLGVQKDTNHTKFIISLDKPSLEDITIDWWIVDSR